MTEKDRFESACESLREAIFIAMSFGYADGARIYTWMLVRAIEFAAF